MTPVSPHQEPDWKLFLELGNTLLALDSAAGQRDRLIQFFQNQLNARARFWFARPAFPLPGEAAYPFLEDSRIPAPVKKAWLKQTRVIVDNQKRIALPLISQQTFLGVLLVERKNSTCFTPDEIDFLTGACEHASLAMQMTRQVNLKNWRYDRLQLVRQVSDRIANQESVDVLCRQVVGLIREAFDFYFVSIFTITSTGAFKFQASAGLDDASGRLGENFTIELGEGIVGTVAQSGIEILAPDVSTEPLFRYNDALPETRAEVAIPLKIEDLVLGVLDVQNDQARKLHEFDLSILRTLADSVALAIKGAQIYMRLGKRAAQLSAVLDISHAVTSTLDFDDLLEVVVNSIQKHFDYDYIHLFSINPGRGQIIFETGRGERSKSFVDLQVTFNLENPDGMIPWVAREGRTRLANDVANEPLYRPAFLPPDLTRSELAIPLAYAGQVLGVLDLQSRRVEGFEKEDIPLLEAMAASIAIAFRNARLYKSEIWRRQVADSFREIAGMVSANAALEELLERILLLLDQNLPGKASAIWLLENDFRNGSGANQVLQLAATRGVDASRLQSLLLEDEAVRSILDDIIELQNPSIRSPEDPIGPVGRAMGYDSRYSSISTPLRAGDVPLGVLILVHPDPGRYGDEASLISTTFASNAAVAIQNAKLITAAQEQAWISTILFKVAEAAQNSLSTDELLQTMARLTPLLIGVKKCAFFTLDETRLVYQLKSHYGLETPGIENLELGQEVPIVQRLTTTRAPVFIQDPLRELNFPDLDLYGNDTTVVILPLQSRGKLLGAFLVGYQPDAAENGSNAFDQQTLSLLSGIAQQTAVAMENLDLLEAQQEEAYVTAVLLQVAQAVVSQNTLEDTLDSIVHLMPILVGINSCAIYLWDADQQVFVTARAFSNRTHEDPSLNGRTYSKGQFPILDSVFARDELMAAEIYDPDLTIENWHTLNKLLPGDELDDQYLPGTNWLLGVPLSVKGSVLGVMLAAEADVPPAFHERRQELISGIAQQVSLTIQNDRLNTEMVQRERLEKEMQLARQIQRTFLPSRLPALNGWDLDIVWQTAREVGGDFYDLFKLGPDKLGIVIADVSDKGMPAALYMTVARTLIRAFVHQISSPAKVLERVNRLLVGDSQDGLFVTAVYAVLNLRDGTLTYANAGHNLPLLVHSSTGEIETLPKGGMALGVLTGSKIQEFNLEICPGDLLMLYTDGVTETLSNNGDFFGETRLIEALAGASHGTAREILDDVKQQIQDFRQGAQASDDLTIVLINRPLIPEE